MADRHRAAFYISTAIDYVNAPPHLGHAYEKIAADVVARFQRMQGKPVFFLIGTDEHGAKVAKTAADRDILPQAHADAMAQQFIKTWKLLDISYNRFVRTTEPAHHEVVTSLWRTLCENGDIHKASYTGNYCTGCESFLGERDLTDAGTCRIHQRLPEPVSEENYFFRLSRYKAPLTKLINSGDFVLPAFRRQEVLKMLDQLDDISVSRPRTSVSWGIPVPDDPDQVIYVWIDALSNYLTGIGYPHHTAQFEQFWPADCHMIGKDILRFHALYWPAMLMAAGIELPRSLFAHGFINLNDAKISKSLGNVVVPADLMSEFELPNADAIRYYLMTATAFGQDGNFTVGEFKTRVNADLSNNLGNLLNRTLNMTTKYFEGRVPALPGMTSSDALYVPDIDYLAAITADYTALTLSSEARQQWKDGYQFPESSDNPLFLVDTWRAHTHYLPSRPFDQFSDDIRYKLNGMDFEFALFTMFQQLINPVNTFIDTQAPWGLAKAGDTDALACVLYSTLERIRQVALMLYPVIPTLSKNIFDQLGYTTSLTPDNDPDRPKHLLLNGQPVAWSMLTEQPLPFEQPIALAGPILPRLGEELAGTQAKKR